MTTINRSSIKKELKTPFDYWLALYDLSYGIWFLGHEVADGRINDTETTEQTITEAEQLLREIVAEVCQKFDMIPPEDTPQIEAGEKLSDLPSGKTYYRNWCNKMDSLYNLLCQMPGKPVRITNEGNSSLKDVEGICRDFHLTESGGVDIELEDGSRHGFLPEKASRQCIEGPLAPMTAGRLKIELI